MGQAKPGACVACGERTDDMATVYVASERRSVGGRVSHDYRALTRPLCASCAQAHHDREPLHWLFPLVLQLGWTSLAREGRSFLGYMGVLFAIYGLYRLVANLGDLLWRRLRPGKKEPAWLMGGGTPQDMASDCLKDHLKDEYKGSQVEHLETVREYLRRHPQDGR